MAAILRSSPSATNIGAFIWGIVDYILIGRGRARDGNGNPLMRDLRVTEARGLAGLFRMSVPNSCAATRLGGRSRLRSRQPKGGNLLPKRLPSATSAFRTKMPSGSKRCCSTFWAWLLPRRTIRSGGTPR